MFNFIRSISRARQLLKEDNAKVLARKLEAEQYSAMEKELQLFEGDELSYIFGFIGSINFKDKSVNVVTIYKEISRLKLSLYAVAPTLYLKVFSKKPAPVFDTLYIRDGAYDEHKTSLNKIQSILDESAKTNENWPPENKFNLDLYDESSWHTLTHLISNDIECFKKLQKTVATLI